MKDILYRAWNVENKELVYFNPEKVLKDQYQAEALLNLMFNPEMSGLLMQYTGLKDRNGVEIYESDVLKHPSGETFVVEWRDSYCAFRACYIENDGVTDDDSNLALQVDDMGQAIVIGNIYERPDLMK